MKRTVSVFLCLLMLFALIPATQTFAGGRTQIRTISADSNLHDNFVRYGEEIRKPTFTVTEGAPVSFADSMGNWQLKKSDNSWDNVSTGTFSAGTWRFSIQIRTDDPDYVLASNPTVTVNGVQWSCSGDPTIGDTFSYMYTHSPEYVIEEADPITGSASIVNNAVHVGDTVSLGTTNVNVTSPHLLQFQWQNSSDKTRWYDISNATAANYVPVLEDEGLYIRAKITHPYYSGAVYSDVRYVNPATVNYDIIVENGTAKIGSGRVVTSAPYGTFITLIADPAPEGMCFYRWEITGVELSNDTVERTSFTMPSNSVTAKAVYRKSIHTVIIQITPPAIGAEPDYHPVLPADANYVVAEEYGVAWMDATDREWYYETDDYVFEEGHQYMISIRLEPMDGYMFAGPMTITVNGREGSAADGSFGYMFPTLVRTGWQENDGVWYYYDENGEPVTGWQKIGGKWYYMNASGVMQTGWQKIDGKWYYMNASGAMQTGWQQIGGKWYYLNASGVMQTGWQKIGGKWYYMNASGVMQTGWQQIGGKWYYMNASGVMQTGWQKIGGKWYYFNASGVMQTGWQKIDGKWYYFNSSGVMQTGTVTIDGKAYTFDSSGVWQN